MGFKMRLQWVSKVRFQWVFVGQNKNKKKQEEQEQANFIG